MLILDKKRQKNMSKNIFILFFIVFAATFGITFASLIFKSWENYYLPNDQALFTSFKEIKKLQVLEANIFSYQNFDDNAILPFNQNSFVIIARAKASYGLDLSNDVIFKIEKERIDLELPAVKLLSLEMNPHQIDIISVKKGIFTGQNTFEEIKEKSLKEMYLKLKIQANHEEYISKAQSNSKEIITVMLKSIGFKEINIKFKNQYRLGLK